MSGKFANLQICEFAVLRICRFADLQKSIVYCFVHNFLVLIVISCQETEISYQKPECWPLKVVYCFTTLTVALLPCTVVTFIKYTPVVTFCKLIWLLPANRLLCIWRPLTS